MTLWDGETLLEWIWQGRGHMGRFVTCGHKEAAAQSVEACWGSRGVTGVSGVFSGWVGEGSN